MRSFWYVQSRGYMPEQGYTWLSAGEGDTAAAPEPLDETPETLLLRGCGDRSINDLVDDTKSSLLFYALPVPGHRTPVWVLHLSGLYGDGAERGDHQNRDIGVSVLGVGMGAIPPIDLVGVVRHFLLGRMTGALPISYGLSLGTPGFSVDHDAWTTLVDNAVGELPGHSPASPVIKMSQIHILPDTPQARATAGDVLQRIANAATSSEKSLAKIFTQGKLTGPLARPLIAVTSLLGTEALTELRPYIGLSAKVTQPRTITEGAERGRAELKKLEGRVRHGFRLLLVVGVLTSAAIVAVLGLR